MKGSTATVVFTGLGIRSGTFLEGSATSASSAAAWLPTGVVKIVWSTSSTRSKRVRFVAVTPSE